jgi:YidC/Oxa1 family membrane protein insertase
MDRNTVIRWIVIAAAILLFWKFGMPLITGKSDSSVQAIPVEKVVNAPDFVPDRLDPMTGDHKAPWDPPEGDLCTIKGPRFDATLSSRGAALKHFMLRDAQYAGQTGFDMSTTPDHERWRSLRTTFRGAGGDTQLKYDRFVWKLEPGDAAGKSCRFSYADDEVKITKTVASNDRPFELEVETSLENLAKEPRKHAFAIGTYAFRFNKEIKGSLGRVPPFQTEVSCAKGKEITRKGPDDFKQGWFSVPGADRYAAVSNYYFGQAIVPEGPADCRVLSEDWVAEGQQRGDDDAGAVYHAMLAYPGKELAPGERATYKQTAYFGPKERNVLAGAAGGRAGLSDLINLGFFSPIAKFLVGVLVFFHDHVTFGNWGLAIIAMTLCLRIILFPLALQAIRASLGMRKLKPELDVINKKFEGDAQAKHLATMELWRKHKVNPLSGCLPQLVQMPIWFAMYTTLQTAVEMYHTKFLWFADLSAPDKYFILPFVLGGFMIVQQRIVPTTGMDPVQQKMMMYMLPAVFTIMMLFLPAALGVYMLTNSSLYIVQQLGVEQVAKRQHQGKEGAEKKSDITVREVGNTGEKSGKPAAAFGKGKARV